MEVEEVAKLFHDTYERLAPEFGYETQPRTAVAWENVPEPNKSLMIAVAEHVMHKILGTIPCEEDENGEWVPKKEYMKRHGLDK